MTPTNSNSDAASLSVKRELLVAAPAKKTCQPSVRPMCIGMKVTPCNLCALNWQAKGHQHEPASAFALYWNNLSTSIKEISSSSTLQGRDSENEHHDWQRDPDGCVQASRIRMAGEAAGWWEQ
ncbi:hypothetical protein BDR04DRAFT_1119480 [Suillus decipiens]|nr:hypothetical protein BDR04DRAFT_1119480 [Suillus decipiens]